MKRIVIFLLMISSCIQCYATKNSTITDCLIKITSICYNNDFVKLSKSTNFDTKSSLYKLIQQGVQYRTLLDKAKNNSYDSIGLDILDNKEVTNSIVLNEAEEFIISAYKHEHILKKLKPWNIKISSHEEIISFEECPY